MAVVLMIKRNKFGLYLMNTYTVLLLIPGFNFLNGKLSWECVLIGALPCYAKSKTLASLR